MDRHTAHLHGAGFRRLLRLADAAETDTRPGHAFGMEVVEAVPEEPDLGAIEAHLAALGIPVVDKTEWALEHCPDLAAEINAARARLTDR